MQMSNLASQNNRKPVWNVESRLKMGEIYHLLEDRVDKFNQCGHVEVSSIG